MLEIIAKRRGVVSAIALVRIAALMLAALGIGSCGGGGGDAAPENGSKLFVADSGNDAIGSVNNSNPAPGTISVDRVITGTSSNFITGTLPALFLDAPRDQLYVSNETSIFVFHKAGTANGPVNYDRRVATLPGSGNFNSMGLDATRDYLYVGDLTIGVRVYHSASMANESGAATNPPSRTIASTDFGTTFFVRDIAFDSVNDILYVAVVTSVPALAMSIFAFEDASTLDGTTLIPDRTITITTGSFGSMALFMDAARDRLYFADSGGGVSIFENASTRDGAAVPERSILLPSVVSRIAVDTVNDRLYAAGSTALYIVPGVSTASGAVLATAALAPGGGNFTAVAVRP